ncbi:MAG: phosphatidylglycerol lysyltransferase domain-containing protein [Deltaproteobacteria bacterium]|nr:phosphatidylglycerol lysyltransferase domain-containing protein [Deltaproteobacteria bacterium]
MFIEYEKKYPLSASDCNFTNLFIWRHYYNFTWARLGDSLCVMADPKEAKPFCLPPLGDYKSPEAWDFLADCMESPFFSRVPENCKDFISQERPGWLIVPDRDNDDYVYSNNKLITLSGRIMHQKKNHYNYFRNNYPHEFARITSELFPELMSLDDRWMDNKVEQGSSSSHLIMEKAAISELLNNFEELEVSGLAVKVNGRIEGFSIGEMLNEDTIVVHVEKGNPDIRGIYVAVFSNFCGMFFPDAQYVNREQDLGLPGLRNSKLSLKPVHFVNKFNLFPKGEI